MSAILSFFVPGIPQPKGSTRAFVPKGWKSAVVTSANPHLKGWEQMVAYEAKLKADAQDWQILPDAAYEVGYRFYFQEPKSHAASKFYLHTVRPDLDKLIRGINDPLSGIVWKDDSKIYKLTDAVKLYVTDGEPGVLVTIVERPGVR